MKFFFPFWSSVPYFCIKCLFMNMFLYNNVFLDASASLSEALSVGPSIRQSVVWLVMLSSKSMKNGLFRILDEEERETRRKEGRGGRSDEKSKEMKPLPAGSQPLLVSWFPALSRWLLASSSWLLAPFSGLSS